MEYDRMCWKRAWHSFILWQAVRETERTAICAIAAYHYNPFLISWSHKALPINSMRIENEWNEKKAKRIKQNIIWNIQNIMTDSVHGD